MQSILGRGVGPRMLSAVGKTQSRWSSWVRLLYLSDMGATLIRAVLANAEYEIKADLENVTDLEPMDATDSFSPVFKVQCTSVRRTGWALSVSYWWPCPSLHSVCCYMRLLLVTSEESAGREIHPNWVTVDPTVRLSSPLTSLFFPLTDWRNRKIDQCKDQEEQLISFGNVYPAKFVSSLFFLLFYLIYGVWWWLEIGIGFYRSDIQTISTLSWTKWITSVVYYRCSRMQRMRVCRVWSESGQCQYFRFKHFDV